MESIHNANGNSKYHGCGDEGIINADCFCMFDATIESVFVVSIFWPGFDIAPRLTSRQLRKAIVKVIQQ